MNASSKSMARPLGVRGHQKSSNLVASNKGDGEMFVESADESTTLLALDIDPRIRRITPQPFTVRLDLGQLFPTRSTALKALPSPGLRRLERATAEEIVYTPDFLAEQATPVPLVVESKAARGIDRIGPALERRRQVLNALGFRYLVIPSTALDFRGLHPNLVRLRDARKYEREHEIRTPLEQLEAIINSRPERFILKDIRGAVSDLHIYLGVISGLIGCDLRGGHFGVATVLWKAHGDLSHLQLLDWED